MPGRRTAAAVAALALAAPASAARSLSAIK